MKILRLTLFSSLFLLLAGTAGCSAFRAMFSRDTVSRKEHKEDRPRRKTRDSAVRDPIRDMFKVRNRPSYMDEDNLTERERALLREERNSNDLSVQRKRFQSDYESEQKKRRDWVFSR
jgi:hypothetical protein